MAQTVLKTFQVTLRGAAAFPRDSREHTNVFHLGILEHWGAPDTILVESQK